MNIIVKVNYHMLLLIMGVVVMFNHLLSHFNLDHTLDHTRLAERAKHLFGFNDTVLR